jgi:hypothetical protein
MQSTNRHNLTIGAALVVTGVSIPATAAYAQAVMAPATDQVSLAPLVKVFFDYIWAALVPSAMWALMRLASLLGVTIDKKKNEHLSEIAMNGLEWAHGKLEDVIKSNEWNITIRNELVRTAAEYAIRRGPGLVKGFGMSTEDVEEFVDSRLNLVIPSATQSPGANPPGSAMNPQPAPAV